MLRSRIVLVLVMALIAASAPATSAQEGEVLDPETPASSAAQGEVLSLADQDGTTVVFVQLEEAATAEAFAAELDDRAGAAAQAQADAAAQDQLVAVEAEQARFDAAVDAADIPVDEVYRTQRILNGVALQLSLDEVDALQGLPGVTAIIPMPLEHPTNASSVPFLDTPSLWDPGSGLAAGAVPGLTGEGTTIGIIDSGIDYEHPMFGGAGDAARYAADDTAVIESGTFPTARVVGGHDFVGDAYTGGNAPSPDPDPMDCNGHGSHVGGTAGGGGVNPDGTPFNGPYDGSTDLGALRIGPGVAPEAELYALRVFGCTGGTNFAAAAIEWAMDPDGDGNLSDHLDVINLSLGGAYQSATSVSALAADAAAAAGVIVVGSAGNSGDTHYVTGGPGGAARAISVAASGDPGESAGAVVRVTAPAAIAGDHGGVTISVIGAGFPQAGVSGSLVLVDDGSGTAEDGCQDFTGQVGISGNLALTVLNGACNHTTRIANAAAAGATGLVIVNSSLVAEANVVPVASAIPTVRVPSTTGQQLLAEVGGGITATMLAAPDALVPFSSRGPVTGLAGAGKPDLTAPGYRITSAQTGITSGADAPGGQALTISGTSMAAPHVAGMMALLRELHPDWTVEELKALAMNTTAPVTAPAHTTSVRGGRGGAGRIAPVDAARSSVVAFNAEDAGVVGVAFDVRPAGAPTIITRRVRVTNLGDVARTYTPSISTEIDTPGVVFGLPDASDIIIPAGGSTIVEVSVTADPALMDRVGDPSLAVVQDGALLAYRHVMAEESGLLTLTTTGLPTLVVPLHAAPQPVAEMSAPDVLPTGGALTGTTDLALSGFGVCTGTLVGAACTGTFPGDRVSIAEAFEHQISSPRTQDVPASADIQHAGVRAEGAGLAFGVSLYGSSATPASTVVSVQVDADQDGTFDRAVSSIDAGQFVSGGVSDIFVDFTHNSGGSGSTSVVAGASPGQIERHTYHSSVRVLHASFSGLGLADATDSFDWRVATCPRFDVLCQFGDRGLDTSAPATFTPAAAGVTLTSPTVLDLPGALVPVAWNTTNLVTDASAGVLVLHAWNGEGARAEIVPLEGVPATDLDVDLTVDDATPAVGQQVVFTATVTNTGTADATDVELAVELPPGYTRVSGIDPATGFDVASLPAGGSTSATLEAIADVTGAGTAIARLSATSPVDPDPSNDSALVVLNTPRTADVGVTVSVTSPSTPIGAPATYTITVDNDGGDPAHGIVVTNTLPTATVPIGTSTVSRGLFNPATGTWRIASLGVGASATLTITASPVRGGPLANTASVSAEEADADLTDNIATGSTSAPNQLPTGVDAGGPYATQVGQLVTLAATGSDPDGDAVTFAWDLDDDGQHDDAVGPSPTVTFPAANPALTIAVQVRDPDGGSATDTAPVAVAPAPVAPSPAPPAPLPPPPDEPHPTPTPTVDPAGDVTTELRGGDNVARAIAWSRSAFAPTVFSQSAGGPETVLLGRDDVFADALASGTAQGVLDAPLLVTGGSELDPRTRDELDRLNPQEVILLGGTAALSEAVETAVVAAGFDVRRIAGTTRLETAVAIADAVAPDARAAILVRAYAATDDATQAFADTLAGGALAAESGVPMLLTETGRLSTATAEWLVRSDVRDITIIGGTAAVSEQVEADLARLGLQVSRVAGATRVDSAIAVSMARGFTGAHDAGGVALIDGQHPDAWVDAYAGTFSAARDDLAIVLSTGGTLPQPSSRFLAGGSVPLTCGTTATESACALATEALGR